MNVLNCGWGMIGVLAECFNVSAVPQSRMVCARNVRIHKQKYATYYGGGKHVRKQPNKKNYDLSGTNWNPKSAYHGQTKHK